MFSSLFGLLYLWQSGKLAHSELRSTNASKIVPLHFFLSCCSASGQLWMSQQWSSLFALCLFHEKNLEIRTSRDLILTAFIEGKILVPEKAKLLLLRMREEEKNCQLFSKFKPLSISGFRGFIFYPFCYFIFLKFCLFFLGCWHCTGYQLCILATRWRKQAFCNLIAFVVLCYSDLNSIDILKQKGPFFPAVLQKVKQQ